MGLGHLQRAVFLGAQTQDPANTEDDCVLYLSCGVHLKCHACHYLYPLLQLPAALSREVSSAVGRDQLITHPLGGVLSVSMKHAPASFEASSENSLGSTFLVPGH